MKNIKKLSEIIKITREAKRQGFKVVTTNGAYDILHIGHLCTFEFAKGKGDILIVGVNSDKSVKLNKDPNRPIIGERERAEMVVSLKPVDYVFIFNEKTSIPWLEKIKSNIHVKGGDRTLDQVVEKDIQKKIGTKLILAPFIKGKSSTNIIAKIQKM